MASGEHSINAGASVPAVKCPAKSCGTTCPLCEGRGVVPRFIAERYRFPSAHHTTMGET